MTPTPTTPDRDPVERMHAAMDAAWNRATLAPGVTVEETPHGIAYVWGTHGRYAAVTVDWCGDGEALVGRYVDGEDRGYWATTDPDDVDGIADAITRAGAWAVGR